jgi:uncharacterized protein YndB with AHSA1/START domain
MPTENETTTQSAPGELEIIRHFDAPRDLVFKVWTDPAHLAQWWGPNGFTNPRCEWDARPGGLIHVDMRGPDGTVYPMSGLFREIVAPERLVFVSAALDAEGTPMFEILNTVTFANDNGGTTLTLRTHLLSATGVATHYLKGAPVGWSQSLERLRAMVEPVQKPDTSDREIVITREFDAPRELLWEAMIDPRHVIHWWGPRGFTTTIEEMDVRPGGVWKQTMHGPDGANYPNQSTFTEVVKPERIAFSLHGRKEGGPGVLFESTWTFEDLEPGRARVTIRMVFPNAEARDRNVREFRSIEGGTQTLERLAEHAAKTPVIVERTFDAPVNTVWKAITELDAIKEWFFELGEFKAEPGFEFRFHVLHEGTDFNHHCVVTEVIPAKKLSYTWRYEGCEGDSLVTYELFPEGDKTKLRLTHTGLDTFPKTPAYARKNFQRGWTMIIGSGLPEYLNTAHPDNR